MTTFEEACEIVRTQLSDFPNLHIADWGYETNEWWQVVAGDRRYLVDGDRDYMLVDGGVYLVNKSDGTFKSIAYLSDMEFFKTFTPFGNVPLEED